jgi:hypothetical protein
MKLLLMLLFVANCCLVFSQNTAVKCIKTSWPLTGVFQIDTYNESGKKLEFMMINEHGDTTQYWKYIYDSLGILARSYSVIERHHPFDHRYVYDSLGKKIARISIKADRIDTFFVSASKVNVNEFGDPIFNDTYGFVHYVYDSSNKKVKETCINESGDTTGVGIYFYDDFGNQINYQWYENQQMTYSQEFKYDLSGNLISDIRKNGNNEIIYVAHHEYLQDGFLFRSYGVDYRFEESNWEILFEIINCTD